MIYLIAFIAAVIGIFVGGLINVLADHLPGYEMPRLPRYPDGKPRPLIAWLGIGAFITNQRCSMANANSCLGWRYPITEIATALAFFVTVLRIETINQISPQFVNLTQAVFYLFYVAVFVLVFVIDVEHHLILFNVVIPASVVALIDAAISPPDNATTFQWWQASMEPTLFEALGGAALGFGIFFLFYIGGFVYQRASAALRGWAPEEVPFGYGDVMLITLCGLILGWRPLIFAMFLTVFLGAVGALLFISYSKLRRRGGGLQMALPYGPYIILGTVTVLLFTSAVQRLTFALAGML